MRQHQHKQALLLTWKALSRGLPRVRTEGTAGVASHMPKRDNHDCATKWYHIHWLQQHAKIIVNVRAQLPKRALAHGHLMTFYAIGRLCCAYAWQLHWVCHGPLSSAPTLLGRNRWWRSCKPSGSPWRYFSKCSQKLSHYGQWIWCFRTKKEGTKIKLSFANKFSFYRLPQ